MISLVLLLVLPNPYLAILCDLGCEESESGQYVCNEGFYLNSNLSKTNSIACLKCHQDCEICESENICLTCLVENSVPSNLVGCECDEGYWIIETFLSFECSECSPGCDLCTESGCKVCDDLNAVPYGFECLCKTGFYNLTSLTDGGICLPCHDDCETCSESSYCDTCKDPAARPVSQGSLENNDLQLCTTCRENCLECDENNQCLKCKKNTYSALCLSCDQTCSTCSGPEYYECLSCEYEQIKNTCSKTCPIGFMSIEGECKNDHNSLPTLRYQFEGIGYIFLDHMNNISATATKPKGRALLNSAPIVAYGRGVYFPEYSSLEISEKRKIFHNEFSLSLWFRPKTNTSSLISKSDESETFNYLTIEYNEMITQVKVLINGSENDIISSRKLQINKWNHIYFSLSYSDDTLLKLWVNKISDTPVTVFRTPFTDSDDSLMLIGSNPKKSSSFKGFIYSLEIFGSSPELSSLISTKKCNSCDVCLTSGTCLSLCEIEEYIDENQKSCKKCPKNCINQCIDSETCLSCSDSFCAFCSNFEKESCYECLSNFEMKEKSCEKCENSQYFDNNLKICKDCPSLCLECASSSLCLTCIENAVMIDSKCVCQKGFSFDKSCKRNYFSAKLIISDTNSVTLRFSEPLAQKLKKKAIRVKIDEKLVKFDLIIENNSKYDVRIDEDDIKENSKIFIQFLEDVFSSQSSLLSQKIISGKLQVTEEMRAERELKEKTEFAETMGRTGAVSGLSAALLLSVANGDSSTFFDFISTAEIFYSVYLFNYHLNPVLSSFLIGMRLQGRIPNFFYLLLDSKKGIQMTSLLKNFGFLTNLMLLNIGPYLESLIFLIFSGFSLFIISKIPCLYQKINSIVKDFKFCAFLRFWIQSFYEICTALVFAFKYVKLQNNTQIVDFCFCLIFALAQVFGVAFMVFLVNFRRRLQDEQEIKRFLSRFGTFFYEFRERGLKDWLFYVLFVLRRIVIVMCYGFIEIVEVQLAFSLLFSLMVRFRKTVFYFLMFWPNKQMSKNVYHVINEVLISSYMLMLIVGYADKTLKNSDYRADICIYLIYIAWGINIGCSLFISLKKMIMKVKECLEKRRLIKRERKYINKTSPDIVQNFPKAHIL